MNIITASQLTDDHKGALLNIDYQYGRTVPFTLESYTKKPSGKNSTFIKIVSPEGDHIQLRGWEEIQIMASPEENTHQNPAPKGLTITPHDIQDGGYIGEELDILREFSPKDESVSGYRYHERITPTKITVENSGITLYAPSTLDTRTEATSLRYEDHPVITVVRNIPQIKMPREEGTIVVIEGMDGWEAVREPKGAGRPFKVTQPVADTPGAINVALVTWKSILRTAGNRRLIAN